MSAQIRMTLVDVIDILVMIIQTSLTEYTNIHQLYKSYHRALHIMICAYCDDQSRGCIFNGKLNHQKDISN